MKIRLFGKVIELNEKNPGIDFFLNECCEFPTETFMKLEYSRLNKCAEPDDAFMKSLSLKDLTSLLRDGIIETLELEANLAGVSYDEEINHVKNAFK